MLKSSPLDGHEWGRHHKDEMQEAREIQLRLMPRRISWLQGFDIAAAGQPARTLSGDYFDVMRLPGHRLCLSIADVSGTGVPAALLASHLQAMVRATAEMIPSPAKLCQKLNREISRSVPREKFVSFFYGLLDSATKQFAYTNAGHNPPLLLHANGKVVRLEEGGLLLGLFEDSAYSQGEVEFQEGDRMLLYTDGVTDALSPSGEEYGEARLVQFLRENGDLPADVLQVRLAESITSFSAGNLTDDTTMIVVAVNAAGESGPRMTSAGVAIAKK